MKDLERDRRGEAMHQAVTGCPEVWAELDEGDREDWRETADRYHEVSDRPMVLRVLVKNGRIERQVKVGDRPPDGLYELRGPYRWDP